MDKLPKKELHGQNPVVTYATKTALNQFEAQSKTRPTPPTGSGGSSMSGGRGPSGGNFRGSRPGGSSYASGRPPLISQPPPRTDILRGPPPGGVSIPPPGIPGISIRCEFTLRVTNNNFWSQAKILKFHQKIGNFS